MLLKMFPIALTIALMPVAGANASGEDLYAEHCAACHGDRVVSTGAVPDLRSYGPNDREKFDKMMAEGRGQMPSWEGVLSPSEQDDIWNYIRSRAR
jgi:mono/diheme cytochrome c family protein